MLDFGHENNSTPWGINRGSAVLVFELCQGMLIFFTGWSALVWFYLVPVYTAILFVTSHTNLAQCVFSNKYKHDISS